MFVTVVAVMCHLLALGGPVVPACEEAIVTTSDLTPSITFFECMTLGQAPIAQWKTEHAIYRSDAWRIERYKCVPGRYEIKGAA